MQNKSEKHLIKQVVKGNSASFGYFVDTYQDMAMTIAFRILDNQQDAEDAVQNAFVKAFHNIHTYRSKSKFSTWFYRIVYNSSLTAYNKIKNRNEDYNIDRKTIEPIEKTHPDQSMEEQEEKERVERAVQQLPNSEAVIVSLYYLKEYGVKEIAEIMSITKSNVKIKLFRARKKLQVILKQ